MAAPHTITAYNTSHASENKIHDDAVAKRFGFTGGLVPGVDVYAYMAHQPVAEWGLDWLRRGTIEARFAKPVYDGRRATTTAEPAPDGTLALAVESEGVACASGSAALPPASAAPALAEFASAPPPAKSARPPASTTSLAPGVWLGMQPRRLDRATLADYLADVRETDGIYLREGVAHPGWLVRAGNAVLVDSVVLGPWIHVGSRTQHFDVLRVDEEMSARARVVANYEKKGHEFVDLDVAVIADNRRVVARIAHTAIWRLRG